MSLWCTKIYSACRIFCSACRKFCKHCRFSRIARTYSPTHCRSPFLLVCTTLITFAKVCHRTLILIPMKIRILFTLLLLCLSLWSYPERLTAQDDYLLEWAEEFNQDGAPDSSSWTYEEGFVRNREVQWYQPQNATCRDGVLVITARSETRPNPTYRPDARHWGRQRRDITLTSACVTTKGLRSFHYGRLEIRARIPASQGAWPAIWMLGTGNPWPECGEVDIMEFYPSGGVRSILANACWGGSTRGRSAWDSGVVPYTHFTSKDSLWATKFHVWRADWDANFIRLYLDDELLNEIDLSRTFNGSQPEGANPLRQPMYLLLNLAMGSSGGRIDAETLPVRFEVDYVRYYRKKK